MRKLFVSCVVFLAVCAAIAKTTTWTGGAGTASVNDSSNWDNGVPTSGDTVVIDAEGTYSSNLVIGSGTESSGEALDIGSEGITLQVDTAYTKFYVNFTGSGGFVKTGSGRLSFMCDSDFTGGAVIQAGTLGAKSSNRRFGTGTITFSNDGGDKPYLLIEKWAGNITNDLVFTGGSTSYTIIKSGQAVTFFKSLTIEHDAKFEGTSGAEYFKEDVLAHGHTLTVYCNKTSGESSLPHFYFEKKLDANVVKTGNRTLYLRGVTDEPDNTLDIQAGSCEIAAEGYWGGTNIVLSGSATNLTLNGTANISTNACIYIEEDCDAKLSIAGGWAIVKKFSVGGVELAAGAYSSVTLPDVITTGILYVGCGKRTVWIGGTTGTGAGASAGEPESFLDPSKWDNGVPVGGDVIAITNASKYNVQVYFGTDGESLDFGEKGIVIDNIGWVKSAVNFVGSGKVLVIGSGVFGSVVDSDHTGGTTIAQGKFQVGKGSLGFGTGAIEFLSSDGVDSMFSEAVGWGYGVTNEVQFAGSLSYRVFQAKNSFVFSGPISSEHDFSIDGVYGAVSFDEDVSAVGHTFTVNPDRETDDHLPDFTFAKSVNADIVKVGNRTVYLNGVTSNPDNLLTISNGVCEIGADGQWGGTNIVIEANATSLSLTAECNLVPQAVVRIDTTSGATIAIASDVKVAVAELYVNGEAVDDGTYSSGLLPGVISGSGWLKVGDLTGLVVIFR